MSTLASNNTDDFPCNASLTLPGPVGALEALTSCPSENARVATVVICHPHPLHGGTMQNKVVHTLARTFGDLGLRTVRFNFRGVGESVGEYGHGVGETEDALSVLRWVRARRPNDELWIAGFSFGAYIALCAAARMQVAQLVLVAPPVHLYDQLGAPPAPTAPVLILQGDADEVVSPQGVYAWATTLTRAPNLRKFEGVGHFFHGRLNDLRLAIHDELRSAIPLP